MEGFSFEKDGVVMVSHKSMAVILTATAMMSASAARVFQASLRADNIRKPHYEGRRSGMSTYVAPPKRRRGKSRKRYWGPTVAYRVKSKKEDAYWRRRRRLSEV